jgi:nascent polypeptide-associated complex subunit alpha
MDMKALAKRLKTKQLSPKRVVFEFDDEQWTFDSPQVVEADMMGNRMYQVIGKPEVAAGADEDLQLIMEKTGCSKAEAKKALEATGDVAGAILHISENE